MSKKATGVTVKIENEQTKVRAILVKAEELISSGWCKGVLARDRNDHGVNSDSKDAVSWCAMGAIDNAALGFVVDGKIPRQEWFELSRHARLLLRNLISVDSIPDWNDKEGRTQSDVVEAFRGTIDTIDNV
jgi:hypothetical protein